jgi:hypothetical protein
MHGNPRARELPSRAIVGFAREGCWRAACARAGVGALREVRVWDWEELRILDVTDTLAS